MIITDVLLNESSKSPKNQNLVIVSEKEIW
jgi:hypothetical protein